MSRIIAVATIFLLAPLTALAQSATDAAAQPPTPPKASEQLPPVPDRGAAVSEDPLNRIEQRLDQIESRLQGATPGATTVESANAAQPAAAPENNWRYRNYNGTWWYWMPSNRWVYWSNGEWVDFVPTTQPSSVVYGSVAPAYSYAPSYGYSSLYSYGYPSYSSYGYYPRYGGYYGSGYYGGGYYGGLGAVGLGLAIGSSFSHNHYHGNYGHYHGGHVHGGGGHVHGGGGHVHGGHVHGGGHHH